VARLVVGRGVKLAGAGLGIGLVLAAALTRFASFLLYGTSPLDPGTFAGVTALLGATALFAAWAPARRAAAVEPIVALRED
jgi:ABC-type antimicrobial peptide transport system permease subunit